MSDRIIFMGTPDFAVPALQMLATSIHRDKLMVVTQPDRSSGRGRKLQAPPVKRIAQRLGLDLVQVDSLRNAAARERIEAFAPDLVVVAAFGLLLPKWILELPGRACVNLHASLLPRFRGASPIPAAIACGDSVTGVSLMMMERGLDTGDVYATQEREIEPGDTTESLTGTLARDAASLLQMHLGDLLEGRLAREAQAGEVIETRKIQKAHGAIDWSRTSAEIERHVRAMWSWPRAWTSFGENDRIQLHQVTVTDRASTDFPGTVRHDAGELFVVTGDGLLRLDLVQVPGKAAQPASELIQHPLFAQGSVFGKGTNFIDPEPWIVPVGEA